jgi:hypothetical protein
MKILAYLWIQCTKFYASRWTYWYFTSFYLQSCIWLIVIGGGSDSECALNFVKISENNATKTMIMIRQKFEEVSINRTRKVQTHRDWKETRQVKSKVKSILIISIDIKWIVHKEFVLVYGKSIPHINVTFTATAGKYAKTSPRTLRTKDLTIAARQCTVWHLNFHLGISDAKQNDCRPHPPYFSLFPRLKIKLKGRLFVITEVIQSVS